MTPEQIAKGGSEHSQQAALFCWAALNQNVYPQLKWMFAIPNGGLRNKITAGKLKAEGVKAGVPDIFLPVAAHGKHGLFVEMKVGKNVARANQDVWSEHLKNHEYGYCICFSWQEARDLILNYLGVR